MFVCSFFDGIEVGSTAKRQIFVGPLINPCTRACKLEGRRFWRERLRFAERSDLCNWVATNPRGLSLIALVNFGTSNLHWSG